ncbi:cell division protein FtsZ [Verminephrobacter aporrectodeae subsp. tuberculatae]|uniref:Cell division protein FtsZ n=1 Tax=Verminephrobacter aporrectodeae subsp. tuberculatae TaxID=1110392 RepID=A0ABT3KRW2_9BURK|nr:cell division protein FtsZ [Verminephrobacter aporrectodeae]MCW5256040.1 cell division protein FtsZ [Verminephrobacter aporrectodeae subsp. tuberculatae]MCW5321046.1 cell division protein FtsZ [Verminephrobacter aporrectodeae subsp. tuberculatae]MCW8165728.1 cell division protein FtsZ [Verminephrobacter aporrectodeae subsp. tuberculatae]MCW8169741.1 cell division protein FtsZ [Verminephrobacter aporrectodeae subsp. tuberculatae]MCW8199553.1 cell division protein FtsZ [Verminephrobacter apor
MSIEMIETAHFNQGTQIKVIGVGGGGSNAVEHMIARGVQGVEFVCANTDAQALGRSSAHRLIQLGESGLGAGSKPEKGRDAAQTAEDDIRSAIDGAHMLFITAGMGGGTGTGAAPVIARVAKEMGILTVGVVTKPFDWEGGRRMANADNGLSELEANVDSLIVVLNEKLLEVLGQDITQDEAFAHANDVLKNAVGGIAEIINEYGHVNVDFEDVRTVMGEPGKAMMGTATASGPDRARIAAEQAVACPLLEGIDLSGARGVLVLVTAAKGSLKLSESRLAMSTINAYSSPDAHVIYGAAYDDSLGEELRVTVVATGLSRPTAARRQPITVVQGGLRTGTDNRVHQLPTAVNMPGAGSAQTDYGNMAVPSVWRTNRSQAAARVDALSSGGMDDLEIPAFLRKQAD